jgi:hypothetical protein
MNTPIYPHRRNRDGSFDSICPVCFVTVSHSKVEAELVELDQTHVCDPALLLGRDSFSREDSKGQDFKAPGTSRAPMSSPAPQPARPEPSLPCH